MPHASGHSAGKFKSWKHKIPFSVPYLVHFFLEENK